MIETLELSDWISIAGILVTIVGFAITVFGVWKAKTAATSAREAAERVQASVIREAVIVSFSSALTAMEEIKRLHRVEAWALMPERYSSLRKHMILIISTHKNLSEEHKASIQTAITQFRELERKVESSLAENRADLNSAKMNKIVTAQLDKLDELLNFMKTEQV